MLTGNRSTNSVVLVGIKGPAGSGKDTLADMIYKELMEVTARQNISELVTIEKVSFAAKLKSLAQFMYGLSDKDAHELLYTEAGKRDGYLYLPASMNKEVRAEFVLNVMNCIFGPNEAVWHYFATKCYGMQDVTDLTGRIHLALSFYLDAVHPIKDSTVRTMAVNVRLALQQLGTNAFRQLVHTDFWLALVQFNPAQPTPTATTTTQSLDEALGSRVAVTIRLISDARMQNELTMIKASGGITCRIFGRRDMTVPQHESEETLEYLNYDTVIDNSHTLADLREKAQALSQLILSKGIAIK
jgi:hypothetical protein